MLLKIMYSDMLYDLKKLDTIYQKGARCTGKTGNMAIKESLSGKTHAILKICKDTGNFAKT